MFNQLRTTFAEVVWPDRYVFFGVFFVVLLSTHSALAMSGLVPEAGSPSTAEHDLETTTTPAPAATSSDRVDLEEETSGATEAPETSESDVVGDMVRDTEDNQVVDEGTAAKPIRIRIDALDRDITVLNPTSRRVSDLDAALRQGAVRHPDSADFAREGNIFILGHSSYLPNVLNRNYQIFNGIENLQWGDTIRVYSEDTEYIYRVERVYEANARDAVIPIAGTGPRLTLATCDSFGSLDDRFIVEADLQSSRPIDR